MKGLKKDIAIYVLGATLFFCPLYWYSSRDTLAEDMAAVFHPASVKIAQEEIAMGNVVYGTKYKATYKIENMGFIPLFIQSVKPSCGCIKVEWSKKPLSPGQTTEINVTFKPKSLGKFSHSIKILCNSEESVHILKLTGEVSKKH